MSKISLIYVDDMELGIAKFEKVIEEFDTIELKATFNNASEALEYCVSNPPDLVVADIVMPGKDGLWLAKQLRNLDIPFAFLSSHNDNAAQSYELQALHYLTKPVTKSHITELLIRYNQQYLTTKKNNVIQPSTPAIPQRIFVNTQKQILIIQLAEIVYVNAEGSYTYFHVANGNVIVSGKTMKTYSDALLNNPDFVKIHRTYIINQSYLESINKKKLEMTFRFKNGMQIIVATFRKGEWLENMDDSRS